MPAILGVRCKSFADLYPDKVRFMEKAMSDYVKELRPVQSTQPGTITSADAVSGGFAIELDADGYPVIHCPASWVKVTKDHFEKIYRSYMTIHYRMSLLT
jgi:hypothetical protein